MAHRLFRLAAVLLLALSGLGMVTSSTVAATQSDECAGIEEYVAALEATGAELEATMPQTDDSSMESWTSDDFTAAADVFEAAQESFGEIEPPAIAEEYHALLLEQFGLLGQMFDTMSTTGIFGALIFVQQMDALETQATEAAQAIEGACGVELQDALQEEVTAATPVAGMVEISGASGGTPASEVTSTRENPVSLGQTVQIDDEWQLTVVSVTPNATDLVLNEASFNEPPAEGHQFFFARLRVTYTGDSADEFYAPGFNVVGQSAVSYNQFDDYCGQIPDPLITRELFTGGTIEGNLCWSIASDDADSLVLYDGNAFDEDRVFLSLMPDESPSATPVASGSFVGSVKESVNSAGTPEADQG